MNTRASTFPESCLFSLGRERAPGSPGPARLSGCGVAQIADSVVICLDAFVLPLDERLYMGRQALLERRFISSLGGIFAPLTLGEHRVFAHASDGGLYVGPGAMHRAAYGAALCGLTA